jgi:DNA-binding CsgD family transcriptional regulator
MSTTVWEHELGDGYEALAKGDWERARTSFEAALARGDSPEALDGLGRALWWLRDAEGAVVHRERAYAGFRREGDLARAARIALWLSREYVVAWGNAAAARGWLARAERLLDGSAPGSAQGWLQLARAENARDVAEADAAARAALAVGHATGDGDLELRSLAQLGLVEVLAGRVDEGLLRLDEAMAAVTGGEPSTLETFSEVCCTLLLACEKANDVERPRQWAQAMEAFAREYDHMPLLAFCRTCCADVHAASGRVDASEAELVAALRELGEAGQRARCVHPAVRLAEIRVLQGRLEEAEQLLAGFEDEAEAVDVAAQIRIGRDEPTVAAASLGRHLEPIGRGSLLAAPLLARLVEAQLAAGDLDDARVAAADLRALAEGGSRDRVKAAALVADGRVAAYEGSPEAERLFRDAVNAYADLGLRLDCARARLLLARAAVIRSPAEAVDVARRAKRELESLGAEHEADEAAALLRALGARGRSRPRATGALTGREIDVMRLVAEGLTNAEIAGRLYISPKTVEHHVARIYRKLDIRTRGEAAAWAVRNLDPETALG